MGDIDWLEGMRGGDEFGDKQSQLSDDVILTCGNPIVRSRRRC